MLQALPLARRSLWPDQEEALVRLNGRRAFALFMAMRTGKTPVLLKDWERLSSRCPILVVIAPAGVYRTWETAAQEWLSPETYARTTVGVWQSGGGKLWEREFNKFILGDTKPLRIFLVNVEALSSVKRCREVLLNLLGQGPGMVAIDESVIIKNPKADRTKFILKYVAPRSQWRRILSGLPTPRSPLDLFTQFYFLDPTILGYSNYFAFRARYAIMKNIPIGARTVTIVVNYRDTEQLQEMIAPHSFRVNFRPKVPPTYSIREVPLHQEQAKIYRKIRDEATAYLEGLGHVTALNVISQMIRLHQILCGHTRLEDGTFVTIPENKTRELLATLEDYGGKAVIWCSYDADVRKITESLRKEYGEELGDRCVARFWGGNIGTREDEEKVFLSDPQCRFMVATPDAGGRGRTWTVADLVVYYSSTNDLDKRDQSEQRVQGVEKARGVDYVDLVSPGTVEPKILAALRSKMNMAAVITGDNYRDWIV